MSTTAADRLPPRSIREDSGLVLDYLQSRGWTKEKAHMQARALSLLEWERDLEWIAAQRQVGTIDAADEAAFKTLFRQRNEQAWREFCEAKLDRR